MSEPPMDADSVEQVAERLHNFEYPTYDPNASHQDANRWSWHGDGFYGENGETDHYDEYRKRAREAILAVWPLFTARGGPRRVTMATIKDLIARDAAVAGPEEPTDA